MGVGTMLIFIAMVIIAAVAASVLISTANQTREQSQSTGDQAIHNVASGFVIQDVIGTVDTSDYKTLDSIIVYVRLAAGSPGINMNNVVVSVTSDNINYYKSMGATVTDAAYTADLTESIMGITSWDPADMTATHVVNQGDLVKITISNTASALGIGVNKQVDINIVLAFGTSSSIGFVTPATFTGAHVSLI